MTDINEIFDTPEEEDTFDYDFLFNLLVENEDYYTRPMLITEVTPEEVIECGNSFEKQSIDPI